MPTTESDIAAPQENRGGVWARIHIPGKAAPFFILLAAWGIGVAQTIYSILGSDITFYWPPLYNHVLNSLLIPFFFLLLPATATYLIFLGIRLLNKRIATVFLWGVAGIGATLCLLRLYFLVFSAHYSSIAVTIVAFFILWFAFIAAGKVFSRLLVVLSGAILLSTGLFCLKDYRALTKTRPESVVIERQADAADRDVPVFLLVFDELSSLVLRGDDDHIDRELYPNIAAFADTGTWYPNSTTGESSTMISIKSMISGVDLFRDATGADVAAKVPNVFAYLMPYRQVRVFETKTIVATEQGLQAGQQTPGQRTKRYLATIAFVYCTGVFDPGWVKTPDVDTLFTNITLSKSMSQRDKQDAYEDYVQRFLDGILPDKDQMFFFYSLPPHTPYAVGADGELIVIYPYTSDKESGSRIPANSVRAFHAASGLGTDETVPNIQRSYINQVRYVDAICGRIMERIKEQGLYEDALIILCSDHGVAFTNTAQGRDGRPGAGPEETLAFEMMNAANVLIVKYPHQKTGLVDTRRARSFDICPTILDVLGYREPYPMDGRSLRSAEDPGHDSWFRGTIYHVSYTPRVKLPAPLDYKLKWKEPAEPVPSRWLGHSVSELPIDETYRDTAGCFYHLTWEESLPWDEGGRRLLGLSGISVLGREDRIPDITLIAVNGEIVKAIRPRQASGSNDRECRELGLTNTGWAVTLPPSSLKVGTNVISAFNPLDESEQLFVPIAEYSIDLSQSQIDLLRERS